MFSDNASRRSFLGKILSVAGIAAAPAAVLNHTEILKTPHTVEFVTRFPQKMSLQEYRASKTQFENKDKVSTLIASFKSSKKLLAEEFLFHETYSVWRVTFNSQETFQEWMKLTEELESHLDNHRDQAGFVLEIRSLG